MFLKKVKQLDELIPVQYGPEVDYSNFNAKLATEKSEANVDNNLDFWLRKAIDMINKASDKGQFVTQIHLVLGPGPYCYLSPRGRNHLIQALKDKGFKVGCMESGKNLLIEWGTEE